MQKVLLFVAVFMFPSGIGPDSIIAVKSNPRTLDLKAVFSNEKSAVNYGNYRNSFTMDFLTDRRFFSHTHVSNKENKKQQRKRMRNRKGKSEKYFRQRNEPQNPTNDTLKFILRNNEKANLVRNKTIEILKKGLRILRAGENFTQNVSKSASRINESLLEKILSSASAASQKNVFLSGSSAYKLPLDFEISGRKTSLPVSPLTEGSLGKGQIKRQNKKKKKSFENDYDYEYDFPANFSVNTANDSLKEYENIHYETLNVDKTVGIMLKQIERAFKNLTNCSNKSCSGNQNAHFEDACQKWLDCRGNLLRAFFGGDKSLPSCPCTYPSTVFYDEMIWDKKQKKYFRWKDASNESERLDIYKPGAAYCIRSLLTQGSLSVSSQQCCYDRSLELLTRGSGAGTINFISPDISRKLHYTIDILPWRLCKGDFTRYNTARNANNGNDCPVNPNEEEYQVQVKLIKIF